MPKDKDLDVLIRRRPCEQDHPVDESRDAQVDQSEGHQSDHARLLPPAIQQVIAASWISGTHTRAGLEP
jgi:hypothetical protein